MVLRNVVLTEAMHAGLRLLEQEEFQIAGIRQGLLEGLAQVKADEFAKGSGDEAIRRAFRPAWVST